MTMRNALNKIFYWNFLRPEYNTIRNRSESSAEKNFTFKSTFPIIRITQFFVLNKPDTSKN